MKIRLIIASLGFLGMAVAGTAPNCDSSKARIVVQTSKGDIVLQLDPSKAPVSVKNFCHYVKEKKYDNTIFHRVIPGFMIQGGGLDKDLNKFSTFAPIKNEATNGLNNNRGTVAMARTGVIDSATNQFFINLKNNDFLNHSGPGARYGYAVFAKVVKGMKVVNAIAAVPTHTVGYRANVPTSTVLIKGVKVISAAKLSSKK